MREIEIYLDLEKIKEEAGITFNNEGEYSDNFVQRVQYLAWWLAHHNKNLTKEQYEKANELYDILKNVHSDWEIMRKREGTR